MKKVIAWSLSFLFMILTYSVYASEENEHDHHHGHSMVEDHASHASQESSPATPTIKIDVNPVSGQSNQWQIKLTQIKDNKPVRLEDLKEVHTEKIHLLIIDNTLEDYSHVHPRPLKEPGLYQFEWDPKKKGQYYVWADLFPLATHKEEYVVTEVSLGEQTKSSINQNVVMKNTVNDYQFQLSFEKDDLKAKQTNTGLITITDLNGKPVHDLEPIMGAFAHIVAFSDDMKTIVHIHPMGKEPTKATDRGGPVLKFHIESDKPGFIKLFAQVKINGKEIFVPFGIMVK
ncbi:MAG: hypothetical protein WC748_08395 [Legionellales bacterium]|jgi:hypothetical protein